MSTVWKNGFRSRVLDNMQLPKPKLPLSPPTGQVTYTSQPVKSTLVFKIPSKLATLLHLASMGEMYGNCAWFHKVKKKASWESKVFPCVLDRPYPACSCWMTHSIAQGLNPFPLCPSCIWTHFFLPLSLTLTFFTFSDFFFILNF